jgi:pyruvate-formate lyase
MLKRAVSVLRSGTGYPSFSNDEEIVPALTGINIAPEDARDYSLSGCNEVIISGQAHMGSVEGFINMPKVLAMTLGLEPALCAGKDLSALTTYKALWEAVLETMAFIVSRIHDTSEFLDKHRADNAGGRIGASLLTRGCIERARGYTQGGARYNFCNWDAIGLANLADSLVAVKKLVFETQTLALAELVEILRTNWEGRETLRLQVLNRLPHFGNDCDEVDEVAADLIQILAQMLKKRIPFRGGEYTLGTLAGLENMHVVFGQQTGATPDGRQAGKPLADSLGASQGRDQHGATAMLNSVAKMPARMLPTSVSVNLKLDPKLLSHESGIEKIAALIQGHFLSGGMQLQLNLVNREMLFAARKCPEQHANLMVRVAGYSGRFVALDREVQDEVISRTEHHLATA